MGGVVSLNMEAGIENWFGASYKSDSGLKVLSLEGVAWNRGAEHLPWGLSGAKLAFSGLETVAKANG